MTYGELKKRLLSARWCLIRDLRQGSFKTWTFLPKRNALLSGDGKYMLVLGADASNPNGVICIEAPK